MKQTLTPPLFSSLSLVLLIYRRVSKWLLLFCILVNTANAQQNENSTLNIGNTAPPLRVREWVKGVPVPYFENGKTYIVDFWATWCRPCIQSMPHLSKLANKYRHRATVLAIDVFEKNTAPVRIKHFVDSMHRKMKYSVAVDDSSFMMHNWLEASNSYSIPTSFIVNKQGRVAWIGHPKDLQDVLPKVLNNTWNIENALAARNFERRIMGLDAKLHDSVREYNNTTYLSEFIGNPESALFVIDSMVKKEPALKYAPLVSGQTFYSLLKTNPDKAYEYGMMLMQSKDSFKNPYYDGIIDYLDLYPYEYNTLPEKIFELGAKAIEAKIKNAPYPSLVETPKTYLKMAEWYVLANNKQKAKAAMHKAIKMLKKSGTYIL